MLYSNCKLYDFKGKYARMYERMCVYVCVYVRGKKRTREKGRENDRNGKRKKCDAAHARSSLRKNVK